MDSCASVEKMLRTIGLRPEWTTSGKEAIFRAKYASQEKDPFSSLYHRLADAGYEWD